MKCDKAHIWNNEECLHCKIQELEARNKRYADAISAIANIDTIFIHPDGTDREWDIEEAMKEIEKTVFPIWEELCELSRLKMKEKYPDLFFFKGKGE